MRGRKPRPANIPIRRLSSYSRTESDKKNTRCHGGNDVTTTRAYTANVANESQRSTRETPIRDPAPPRRARIVRCAQHGADPPADGIDLRNIIDVDRLSSARVRGFPQG